ncbi:1017_t:CDS:2, partial [Cetraspora pellucida]
LDYKPGHREHIFYKYWLASNSHTSFSDRNDTALLDAYQPEEIYSQYIIQMAEKPLHLIIDIDARQKPDPNKPKHASLDSKKIIREDLISRILVACADALSLIPDCIPFLNSFALANSSNAEKCSWYIIYPQAQFVDYRELKGFTKKVIKLVGEPYSKFIDVGLSKSRFSLRLLRSAKEGRIKRPAISSVNKGFKNFDDYLVQSKENYFVIWQQTFSEEKPAKEKFKPINDNDALVKGANLAIAEYGWLQIGRIEKGFINFQCYHQKQYKPEHKGISFDKVSDKVELKEKSKKWRLCERLPKALSTPHQFSELLGESINVKEMKDALDAFPDFLSEEPSTTLIRSAVSTGKTKTLRKILASLAQSGANLPCTIWISYRKTLSNESEAKLKELEKFNFRVGQYQNIVADLKMHEWDLIIVQIESILRLGFQEGRSCIAILDEANATMCQMASGVYARESANAMHDLLNVATHVVAMDAFANDSTLAFLKFYRGSEGIRKGFKMLQEVYFGQMDGKQRQDDFANIDAIWSALDCVIYTSTVEAGIFFEISGYFDAVIGITNIVTPVHVEAFAQMLFRIRDCPLHIVSFYHSKKFDIFKEPCQELIWAELSALRPGDLPTIIKGQCAWDKIADCYALNLFPAVETYIEVEYQKCLSAKYFSEILCSLIASTGATLELILVKDTEKINRNKISHTIKNTEKKIKGANAESIANAPDISSNKAEILKQNPIRSFANNMTLQCHYLWRIYASGDIGGKDDIRD